MSEANRTQYGQAMLVTEEFLEKTLVPLDTFCQWIADKHAREEGYIAGPVKVRVGGDGAIEDWPPKGYRKVTFSWDVAEASQCA